VETLADRAVELPPLNLGLARMLVGRTRVARLLRGWRERPAADLDAVYRALIGIAQILVDLPEVAELDVNPLLADEKGVLALDARVRLAAGAGPERLAIRPYPSELEELVTLPSGERVLLRPILPEDEPAHLELFRRLTPEDVYFRFFSLVREMPHSELARYTQVDYDREMALIATQPATPRGGETLGSVRAIFNPDATRAEFAIVVRSDLKGHGLGHALLEKILRYCRSRGTAEVVGQVLAENRAMLALAKSLGFRRGPAEAGVVEVRLDLAAPLAPGAGAA
jgi:acetyltransferase